MAALTGSIDEASNIGEFDSLLFEDRPEEVRVNRYRSYDEEGMVPTPEELQPLEPISSSIIQPNKTVIVFPDPPVFPDSVFAASPITFQPSDPENSEPLVSSPPEVPTNLLSDIDFSYFKKTESNDDYLFIATGVWRGPVPTLTADQIIEQKRIEDIIEQKRIDDDNTLKQKRIELVKLAPDLIDYLYGGRVNNSKKISFDSSGEIIIQATAESDPAKLRSDLQSLGLINFSVNGNVLSGSIPVGHLESVAKLSSLRFASPVHGESSRISTDLTTLPEAKIQLDGLVNQIESGSLTKISSDTFNFLKSINIYPSVIASGFSTFLTAETDTIQLFNDLKQLGITYFKFVRDGIIASVSFSNLSQAATLPSLRSVGLSFPYLNPVPSVPEKVEPPALVSTPPSPELTLAVEGLADYKPDIKPILQPITSESPTLKDPELNPIADSSVSTEANLEIPSQVIAAPNAPSNASSYLTIVKEKNVALTKLNSDLTDLYTASINALNTTGLLPRDFSMLVINGDNVAIEAVASSSDPSKLLSDLKDLGLKSSSSVENYVGGLIPISQLGKVAALSSLRSANAAYKPLLQDSIIELNPIADSSVTTEANLEIPSQVIAAPNAPSNASSYLTIVKEKNVALTKLNSDLTDLYTTSINAPNTTGLLPRDFSMLVINGDNVAIEAVASSSDPSKLLSDLKDLGLKSSSSVENYVGGLIPISQLGKVAALSSLRSANAAYTPLLAENPELRSTDDLGISTEATLEEPSQANITSPSPLPFAPILPTAPKDNGGVLAKLDAKLIDLFTRSTPDLVANYSSYMITDGENISVDAISIEKDPAKLLADLKALGLKDSSSSENHVAGIIPISQLGKVAELVSLNFVNPNYKPLLQEDPELISISDLSISTEATLEVPSQANITSPSPLPFAPVLPTAPKDNGGVLAKLDAKLIDLFTRSTPNLVANYSSYLMTDGKNISIDAMAIEKDPAKLLADLKALGLKDSSSSENHVAGIIPISQLGKVAELVSLNFVNPNYKPQNNAGLATSKGDITQRSNIARSTYTVNGAGVKVGVLSDSYNNLGGATNDVNSGDLPSVVSVLKDNSGTGFIDEGRAMLQIIYDVAPGASLAFNAYGNSLNDFADGITNLAAAGATVITDDIVFPTEPFFQDGVISRAIDKVASNGVAYFSSAGNYANKSYESAFIPSTISGGYTFHDFDPSSAVNNFQRITANGQFNPFLQWDQPFASASTTGVGSQNDLDMFLYNSAGNLILSSETNNFGRDPVEGFDYVGSGTLFLVIGKRNSVGGPNPTKIKYIDFGFSTNTYQFATNSSTSFGHNQAANALGVAAVPYLTPTVPESSTSLGGTPILFDKAGNRLATPIFRNQPAIAAPDGVDTTFFGVDITGESDDPGNNYPNFFGTSAAAPSAAGATALIRQAVPSASNSLIYRALKNTAVDVGAPGNDPLTGSGLIQTDKAIESLKSVTIAKSDLNNADGKADIFFRDPISGQNAVWLMNGLTPTVQTVISSAPTNLSVRKIGNFNGDKNSDIFFRDPVTGNNAMWLTNGFIGTAQQYVAQSSIPNGDSKFSVIRIGDFNGDNKSDIFFRDPVTGENAIWLMNGLTPIAQSPVTGGATAGANFSIVETGDFNGDGKSDLFFRDPTSGQNAIWLMNGLNADTPRFIASGDPSYNQIQVGDFSGDGKSDIFFRNTSTGQNAVWLMDGFTPIFQDIIANGDANFTLVSSDDFNGDSKADILYQNLSTGQNAMWLMNGITPIAKDIIGLPNTNFQVLGV